MVFGEKITPEYIQKFIQMYENIETQATHVYALLLYYFPDLYYEFPVRYMQVDSKNVVLSGFLGHRCDDGFESQPIPTRYLYEDNVEEVIAKEAADYYEMKKKKKLALEQKQKELTEQQEKAEYKRLKAKFEGSKCNDKQ